MLLIRNTQKWLLRNKLHSFARDIIYLSLILGLTFISQDFGIFGVVLFLYKKIL